MSDEQKERYRTLYGNVALLARKLDIAQAHLQAYHRELLIELDVPPGSGIDLHGDGEIKKKADCTAPPEVT